MSTFLFQSNINFVFGQIMIKFGTYFRSNAAEVCTKFSHDQAAYYVSVINRETWFIHTFDQSNTRCLLSAQDSLASPAVD